MRKLAGVIAVLLLPVSLAPLFFPTADAQTHHVDPNDPDAYSTIQAAVDDAEPGDTIRIDAGTFEESVRVDTDRLTLDGAGADGPNATILRPQGMPGFNLTADGLTLDGFRIEGPSDGILARGADGLVVSTVTIEAASGNSVDVALAQGTSITGLTSLGASSNGLRLASVQGAHVDGAYLDGDHRALHTYDLSDATLANLTAEAPSEHGIVVERSQNVTVSDAEADGTIGFWSLASSDVTLQRVSTTGADRHGILIEDTQQATIGSARASGAGANGLIAKGSEEIRIVDGTYTGNLRAIHLLHTDDALLKGLAATRSGEHGVVTEDVSNVTLSDLRVETAQRGIWLIATQGATISQVSVLDAIDDLVNLTGSPDVVVRDATFRDSRDQGFHVFDSPGLTIEGSTIEDTACDVYFRGQATATTRGTSLATTNNVSRLDTDLPEDRLDPCRVEHGAQALDDHPCDETEWHFVINQLDDASEAPHEIVVTWDGSITKEVDLDHTTQSTAHYTTTDHLDADVTGARADLPASWDGRFNLSHGPCHDDSEA